MNIEYYKKIYGFITDAEKNGVIHQVKNATGFSGSANLGLIQRLAAHICSPEKAYLEIGVFQGMTLSHAAVSLPENALAFGIDNFSLFDKQNKNRDIIAGLLRENHISNARLIDEDFEKALTGISDFISSPVGVYLVDGPHDYRSQLVCLLLAKNILSDGSVILVDDSNYPHVRQANYDFLASHEEYTLLFETYTQCHPDNQEDMSTATSGWWNGINVIVKDTEKILPRIFPTLSGDKTLFYNDHAVHSHKKGYLAAHVLQMRNACRAFNIRSYVEGMILSKRAQKAYKGPAARFMVSNTYSETLRSQVNPGVL